jgi:hypothetical protein
MADATYNNQKVYHKRGGDEQVIASGGTQTIESGGTQTIESVDSNSSNNKGMSDIFIDLLSSDIVTTSSYKFGLLQICPNSQ